MPLPDTIFGLATPPGEGAVAIVRVSGPGARTVLGRLFRDRRGRTPRSWKSHRARLGQLVDPASGRCLDEALVLYMEAGRSFTGEDVVELQCHGGPAVVRGLECLLRQEGLRPAQPGEFTRRAFLNGRLSLDEAEAVNDLVRARSEEAALVDLENLSGALRRTVEQLRSEAIGLLALLEANVDFPEDDVDPATLERVDREAALMAERIGQLASTYERGHLLRDGIRVVLCGYPNAGKSSLLNALLKTERAIVTEVPGTTRDTLEETLCFRGLSYVLVDTAGLRETTDRVESLGVARSLAELERAGIVLLLHEASGPLTAPERDFRARHHRDDRPVLLLFSKADLAPSSRMESDPHLPGPLAVSSVTGDGLDELLEALHEMALRLLPARAPGPTVANERQRDCLARASDALESFRSAVHGDVPLDVCLVDLHEAVRALGLITGAIVTEDILEEIFSRFCIGK